MKSLFVLLAAAAIGFGVWLSGAAGGPYARVSDPGRVAKQVNPGAVSGIVPITGAGRKALP